MFKFKFDYNGIYTIRWPEKVTEVIALAEQYIAYETSLSEAQQLPRFTTAVLQPRLDAARAAVRIATLREAERGSSAQTLQKALAQLAERMDKIHALLRVQYFDNLSMMEFWGFPATQGKRGTIVRKPYGQTAVIKWLTTYVRKEASLPLEE